MISLRVGECDVDIMPVVNGILSEADRVREAFGHHEAYAASMGIEGIQAIKERKKLEGDFEVSELDIVYADRMTELTGEEIRIPSPAVCVLVDLVAEKGGNVIPLDMNDDAFTELYCNTVPAIDFIREHGLAKKGLKKKFTASDPRQFAVEWDAFLNSVKSYRTLSLEREKFIAGQIREAAKYRKSLLAVIETERAEGVAKLLRNP